MDVIPNLISDGHIRVVEYNGQLYGSLVDVMKVFSGAKNHRQYWKDHKDAILANDPELVANLYQLKLVADDGKMRLTDVAPLKTCIFVALTISHDLRKQFAGISAAQIAYRMSNVAKGMEWAADTVRQRMIDDGLLED